MKQQGPTRKSRFTTGRRGFLAAGAALTATGCFGSFGLTDALYQWNKEVSDSKWLRWLVFLGLVILPVYEILLIVDALVLNTIEFFTGEHPVGGGSAESDLGDGHTLKSRRTDDPDLVRHEHYRHGRLVRVLYVRRIDDREVMLLDENKKLISRAIMNEKGEIELYDADGHLLKRVSREQFGRMISAVKTGRAVSASIHAEVDMSGVQAQLARRAAGRAAL